VVFLSRRPRCTPVTTKGSAMFRHRPHHVTAPIGAALLAALALTACSASDGGSASSVARVADGPQRSQSAAGADTSGAAKPGAAKSGTGSADHVVSPAALEADRDALARRAAMALQVKNIGQAVARVRAMALTLDGIVLAENIGSSTGAAELENSTKVTATTYGEITLSVPSAQLDKAVAELGSLGTVIRSTSSSENVGDQMVDTASRLATMRVSVERVRKLLEQAKDLSQVVAMEAELTRRQSDLEALEAQLASLEGSVARSPIQVSLTTEPGVIARPQTATGFLAGLEAGWTAFTSSVSVVLTVLGAVLPFAVVLALVGSPAWWFLRRRRALTPPPTVLPE
jgi:hypothetical protein